MSDDSSSDSDGSNTPRARSHRNRSRNRRRRKNRNRNSTIPASLQLGGDDESDDDYNENCRGHQRTSKPTPLPWTNDLHQDFVKAILDIGIDESSPAVIAEQMITKNNYNFRDDDVEDDDDSEQQDENDERTKSPVFAPPGGYNNCSPIGLASKIASLTSRSNAKAGRKKRLADLPQECLYYKRELTGERLKSHLQILRKHRVREMEVFAKDYKRCLLRLQTIDREQKEVREKEQQRRKEDKKRRKMLKRKRSSSQRLPTEAAAFDHLDDLSRTGAVVVGGDETNGDGVSGTLNNFNDDVAKEEEERLLSLYLPPRPSVALKRQRYHDDDFDFDSENDEFDKRNDVFPVGGRAIGMLTWAVQQHEIEEITKRKLRKIQKQKQISKERQQQQHLSPFEDASIGWENNSVQSWTSHTSIHNERVVNIPDRCCRKGETRNSNELVGNCLSACEEEEDDDDDDDSIEDDPFRVSIPVLTEAEKSSPLGLSMRLTWDMIKHMHSVIAEERTSKFQEQQQQEPRRKRQFPINEGNVSATNQTLTNFSECEAPVPAPEMMNYCMLPLGLGSSKAKVSLPNDDALRVGTHESAFPEAAQNASTAMECEASTIDPATNPHLLVAVAANGLPPANLMAALGGAVFAGLVRERSL